MAPVRLLVIFTDVPPVTAIVPEVAVTWEASSVAEIVTAPTVAVVVPTTIEPPRVTPVAVRVTSLPPCTLNAAAAAVVEAAVTSVVVGAVRVNAPKPVAVRLVMPVHAVTSAVTAPAEDRVADSIFFTVALAGTAMAAVSLTDKESSRPAPPSRLSSADRPPETTEVKVSAPVPPVKVLMPVVSEQVKGQVTLIVFNAVRQFWNCVLL